MRVYQAKYKEEFLKDYDFSSRKMYEWLFDKTFDFENKFGKDLFDFNLEEVQEFFSSRRFNEDTTEYYLRRIVSYMDWAKAKGYKRISRNYIEETGVQELSKKFASVSVEYLTFDQISEIVGLVTENRKYHFPELKNWQDKLLVYLLFWGARHRDNLHELTHLKYSDVDFENKRIKLTNIDGEERYLKVGGWCLHLIKKSKEETKYFRYGNVKGTRNRAEFYLLGKSEYIFRRADVGISKEDGDKAIAYQTLRKRITQIGDHLGVKLEPKTLHKSGVLFAVKYMIDKGIPTYVDNAESIVFERYKGYSTYQTKAKLMKEMRELVPDVYGVVEGGV